MTYRGKVENPYIKWFFPILLVMIVDMFYYSNSLVQFFVPFIFYFFVLTLYLTSMHKVHAFYQTLLIRFELPWRGMSYLKNFFACLFVENRDRELYFRIGLALFITFPFLGVFVALLFTADSNFSHFLTNLVDFDFTFEPKYIWTVPFYFMLYLLLFIYSLSNHKERIARVKTQPFDMLIVGIFLGMINLLFLMFIALQVPFLLGDPILPANTSLAEFAREGFFQLMTVMGIVLLIFLFIMRRFKGEQSTTFLLVGLLVQTIIMGMVSLKKMYLYQSIKGATVLRYYVEWFDYFLLLILALGLVFLVRKVDFVKLLNSVAILGLLSFMVVISVNIDALVASHNIEKFKSAPEKLDKHAVSLLSIDALPVVKKSDIDINRTKEVYSDVLGKEHTLLWYEENNRKSCNSFATYHYGYCSILKKYGVKE